MNTPFAPLKAGALTRRSRIFFIAPSIRRRADR